MMWFKLLNPIRPAQVTPWSFQFIEPISCTFYSSQCELGLLSH